MRNHHRKCDCPYHGDNNIYYNSLNNDRRYYGPLRFLLDLFLVLITGGFWLIWIFIREMRNR